MAEAETKNPLVSIIVPSFNQGRFIGETIRSCLDQSYRPIEILVFDGGSTDETIQVLAGLACPELVVLSEPDNGVVDAVNKGLAAARGPILTIQSSDDVFLPSALSTAVREFERDATLDLLYGDVELIDEDSKVVGEDVQGPFELSQYLSRLLYVPQPGTFFSRRAMQRAGPWRSEVSYCADADFWIRIALQGVVRKVDQKMARYRYHADQRDTQSQKIERDWSTMALQLLAQPDLQPGLRRSARVGIHLAKHRYSPEERWWHRSRSLYQAAFIDPRALLHPNFPKRELIPFRYPVWNALSRVKRRLLPKGGPATTP